MFKTPLGRLRWIALAEGVSYLILVGVAMPLKYAFDRPEAVRVVGISVSCLSPSQRLFSMYISSGAGVLGFNESVFLLIPFGAFWMERILRALNREIT